MNEHGIAFSAPMVLALLAEGKTATRRLCTRSNSLVDGHPATKEQWEALDWRNAEQFCGAWRTWDTDGFCHLITPRYRPGDTWYAKEGLQGRGVEVPYDGGAPEEYRFTNVAEYRADGKRTGTPYQWTRSPLSCRFMPKSLARIRGTIGAVTPSTPAAVCTPEEALSEGLTTGPTGRWSWRGHFVTYETPLEAFRALWESLHQEWTPDVPCWRIAFGGAQ